MRKVPNRIRSGRDRDTSSLAALHSPTLASIAAKPTADRSSGGPDAPASAKAAMYAASSRPMSSSYGRRDSMYSARGATAPSSCASSCARRAAVDGSSAARAHGSRFSSSASLLPPMSTSVRTASPARPSSTTRRHTATISAGCVEKASTRRASSASPSPTSPSAPGALAAVDSPRASLPSPPRSDPRSPPSSPASSPASSGVKSCTWMSSLNSGRTSMKSGSATRTGGRAMCSPMNSAYAASESRPALARRNRLSQLDSLRAKSVLLGRTALALHLVQLDRRLRLVRRPYLRIDGCHRLSDHTPDGRLPGVGEEVKQPTAVLGLQLVEGVEVKWLHDVHVE
eukprot:scaffold5892_cov112-Isochrysis_galbana.AAC.14